MFHAEVEQATTELRRPARALFASGAVAGASVGLVVLLMGAALAQQAVEGATFRVAVGAIYATGFTLAILARTDLFTEYTTISVFPLLTGDAGFGAVARLWALVYLGNMFGGFAVALVGAALGPALDIFAAEDIGGFARDHSRYSWWTIILSGVVAGWLMGMLSWLIAGGRDTTSQIVFIWIIGGPIGFLGLHHAITGGVEMMIAALGSTQVGKRACTCRAGTERWLEQPAMAAVG
jgi:formate/nitrite transporter FocA (FNT family)